MLSRWKWHVAVAIATLIPTAIFVFLVILFAIKFGYLPVLAALVPLGAAIIALLSPLFTQVTELSKLRQVWIDALREDVAEFVGLADEWQEAATDKAAKRLLGEVNDDGLSERRKAMVVLFRIRMRINPLPKSPTRFEDDFF